MTIMAQTARNMCRSLQCIVVLLVLERSWRQSQPELYKTTLLLLLHHSPLQDAAFALVSLGQPVAQLVDWHAVEPAAVRVAGTLRLRRRVPATMQQQQQQQRQSQYQQQNM
jgi:hypothetical protein